MRQNNRMLPSCRCGLHVTPWSVSVLGKEVGDSNKDGRILVLANQMCSLAAVFPSKKQDL